MDEGIEGIVVGGVSGEDQSFFDVYIRGRSVVVIYDGEEMALLHPSGARALAAVLSAAADRCGDA